jgi:hypothetical protein
MTNFDHLAAGLCPRIRAFPLSMLFIKLPFPTYDTQQLSTHHNCTYNGLARDSLTLTAIYFT